MSKIIKRKNQWIANFKKSELVKNGVYDEDLGKKLFYGFEKGNITNQFSQKGYQSFHRGLNDHTFETNLEGLLYYLHFIGITIRKVAIEKAINEEKTTYKEVFKKAFFILKQLANYTSNLNIDDPFDKNDWDLNFLIKIEEEVFRRKRQPTLFDQEDLPDFYKSKAELPDGYEKDEVAMQLFNKIETSKNSYFITGKAGTGKSTFIQYLTKNSKKKILVLAPTGIAAVNVGGQTVHSFFRFPIDPLLPEDKKVKPFNPNFSEAKIIKAVDTIIIDEVSMVRSDVIEAIDYSLRKNMRTPKLPFGGKQMLFIGDIFQLPPIVDSDNMVEKELFETIYISKYFFDAFAYERLSPKSFAFQKVHRQVNIEFIRLLNKVRNYAISPEEIELLNQRYQPHLSSNSEDFSIMLTSTNYIAKKENDRKLKKVPNGSFFYQAEIEGDFRKDKFPTELNLELRRGAQVMLIKNDSFDNGRRWVNGTLAKIEFISEDIIEVRLKDGTIYTIEKEIWENRKYSWDKEEEKITTEVIGTFKQFPLKLAWAITIHKSQGLTFENLIIDLGRGAFASGQLYTALSRCKSFEGITLKRKITIDDIIPDNRLIEFYKENISDNLDEENIVKDTSFPQKNESEIWKNPLGYPPFETLKKSTVKIPPYHEPESTKSHKGQNTEIKVTEISKLVETGIIAYDQNPIDNQDPIPKQKFQYKKGVLILIISLVLIGIAIGLPSLLEKNKIKAAYDYFDQGKISLEEGSLIKAKDLFGDAILLKTNIAEFYFFRGKTNYQLGFQQEAIRDYDKAIDLDSKHINAYHNRGAIKDELGDTEGAISDFSKSIQLDPYNSIHYYFRGLVYRSLKVIDPALDDFLKADKILPNNPVYLNGLANIYSDKGESLNAIANYKKALLLMDTTNLPEQFHEFVLHNKGTLHFNLGRQYRMTNNLENAVEHFLETINLEPNNDQAYFQIGAAYDELGNPRKAKSYLEKSISLNPLNTDAFLSLSIVHRNLDQHSLALKYINSAIDLNPSQTYYLLEKVRVLQGLERINESLNILSNLYQINPTNYDISLAYGKNLMLDKRYASAIPVLEQTKQIDSSYYEVFYLLGGAYVSTGNYEQGLKNLIKSTQLNPEHGSSFWDIWAICEYLGHEDIGFPYLKRAEELGEENAINLKREFTPNSPISTNKAEIGFVYTKDNSNLRLRNGPGLDYNIIDQMPNGSSVEIIKREIEKDFIDGKYGNWYKVKFENQIGWTWGNNIMSSTQ